MKEFSIYLLIGVILLGICFSIEHANNEAERELKAKDMALYQSWQLMYNKTNMTYTNWVMLRDNNMLPK